MSRSRRAFDSAAGLGPGLRPIKPRQSRIAAVARSRTTGRAAGVRRAVRRRPRRCGRETRRRDVRRGVRRYRREAGVERQWRKPTIWIGESAGSLVRAITLGRACGAQRTEPGLLVSAVLKKSQAQRRVNAATSAGSRAPWRAVRSSFLRSCRKSAFRRRYSQAKPGASSDRSSSYGPASASRRGSSASSPLASGRPLGL